MGNLIEFIKARSWLNVNFQKAQARPGSIIKARAWLGLEKSGLVPPLQRCEKTRWYELERCLTHHCIGQRHFDRKHQSSKMTVNIHRNNFIKNFHAELWKILWFANCSNRSYFLPLKALIFVFEQSLPASWGNAKHSDSQKKLCFSRVGNEFPF